jgi:hypothetical protein
MNPARFASLALVVAAAAVLLLSACGFDSDSAGAAPPVAAHFACPPKRPGEGKVAGLNKNPKSEESIVPGEPNRLLLCRYLGLNHGARSDTLLRRRLVANQPVVSSSKRKPPICGGFRMRLNEESAPEGRLLVGKPNPTVVTLCL